MDSSTPDLISRLQQVQLPALPQVLVQLMHTSADDKVGLETLAELVAQDAALAANVLKVASSAVYNHGTQPANLMSAMSVIGLDMVRMLLMTQSVYQTFSKTYGSLDLRLFWSDALSTAITARMLAQRENYPLPEEAYLGGLLHDIGRLALVTAAPQQYTAHFFAQETSALCALEERTLEITHAEAGAILVESMILDSFIADGVRYHHTVLSRLEHAHPLVRLIATACQLVNGESLGLDDRALLLEQAGLTSKEYDIHEVVLAKDVKRIAESLGIAQLPSDGKAAAAVAIPAVLSTVQCIDPLAESMRDHMLIDKATSQLRHQTSWNACVEAVVKASVILFGFSDAIALRLSPDRRCFQPIALLPGHQRLMGLTPPATPASLAQRAVTQGKPLVWMSSDAISIAEEQMLRFFQAEALVALPVIVSQDQQVVLMGGVSHANARQLASRLPLLNQFCGRAGAAMDAFSTKESTGSANQAEQADFQIVARQVAHEVSNPLSIIRNYLSVLKRKADSTEPIHAEVSTITEELDRVTQVIHTFAQTQDSPSKALSLRPNCDANAAVRYVSRLFSDSGAVPAGVQIGRHTSSDPAIAAIDENSLRQILVNLVKNAVEAMMHGGRIDLRVAGVVERNNATYAEIIVSDTGRGIPESVQAHLFRPITSTKQGANRGLGLSIVYDLVRRFEGHIEYRTGNAGTQFIILLPADESSRKNSQALHS